MSRVANKKKQNKSQPEEPLEMDEGGETREPKPESFQEAQPDVTQVKDKRTYQKRIVTDLDAYPKDNAKIKKELDDIVQPDKLWQKLHPKSKSQPDILDDGFVEPYVQAFQQLHEKYGPKYREYMEQSNNGIIDTIPLPQPSTAFYNILGALQGGRKGSVKRPFLKFPDKLRQRLNDESVIIKSYRTVPKAREEGTSKKAKQQVTDQNEVNQEEEENEVSQVPILQNEVQEVPKNKTLQEILNDNAYKINGTLSGTLEVIADQDPDVIHNDTATYNQLINAILNPEAVAGSLSKFSIEDMRRISKALDDIRKKLIPFDERLSDPSVSYNLVESFKDKNNEYNEAKAKSTDPYYLTYIDNPTSLQYRTEEEELNKLIAQSGLIDNHDGTYNFNGRSIPREDVKKALKKDLVTTLYSQSRARITEMQKRNKQVTKFVERKAATDKRYGSIPEPTLRINPLLLRSPIK